MEDMELLAVESVVLLEERLDLLEYRGCQVGEFVCRCVGGRCFRHTDQAIVPDEVARLLALLDLENADEAHVDEAAGRTRRVHEDQHVERVAVATFGAGYKAEVERKRHPDRQDVAQPKCAALGVILQLVVAALRRLDHDLDHPAVDAGSRHASPSDRRSARSSWPFGMVVMAYVVRSISRRGCSSAR